MQTKTSSKLTSEERKELMLEFCEALSLVHTAAEAADVITDLLTPKEVETIAKRLKIAGYLMEGKDYHYIRQVLKVGFSTIARVNTWLNLSGEGFKLIFSRKKPKAHKKSPTSIQDRYDPYSWYNIKRRYSLYFWPQLLLDELVKSSDEKGRTVIFKALEKLEVKKHEFSSGANKQLYEHFSKKRFQLSSPKPVSRPTQTNKTVPDKTVKP